MVRGNGSQQKCFGFYVLCCHPDGSAGMRAGIGVSALRAHRRLHSSDSSQNVFALTPSETASSYCNALERKLANVFALTPSERPGS